MKHRARSAVSGFASASKTLASQQSPTKKKAGSVRFAVAAGAASGSLWPGHSSRNGKRSAFSLSNQLLAQRASARRAGEQQKAAKNQPKRSPFTRRAARLRRSAPSGARRSWRRRSARRAPRPPSAKRAKATTPVVTMPAGWADEWRLIKELRKDRTAVVDTMGCERLADPQASEKDRRYHVLVSLMLSSQTKDTVNAAVMGALKARGLSVKRILDETSEDEFHELIKPVGFHNVKTKNIRKATQILRDEYDEDVPNTMEALLALPGVGPKMALLVLKCAFDITAGISVDTHVHRISNQLGWTGGALCGNQIGHGVKLTV